MRKEYLLIVVFALFVWASKDKLPLEYQFWKKEVADVTVKNNSSEDLKEVSLVVFSTPYPVGSIKKERAKTISARRIRESTEVVIRFTHGSEVIERHVGVLDEAGHYQMTIIVSLGGIVTVEERATSEEEEEDEDDPKPVAP